MDGAVEYVGHMLSGAGHIGLLLQPALAVLFGVMHGVRDAHLKRGPFFTSLLRLSPPHQRGGGALRRLTWAVLGALAASLGFQLVRSRDMHTANALLVALALAVLPYLLARDVSARLDLRWHEKHPTL